MVRTRVARFPVGASTSMLASIGPASGARSAPLAAALSRFTIVGARPFMPSSTIVALYGARPISSSRTRRYPPATIVVSPRRNRAI